MQWMVTAYLLMSGGGLLLGGRIADLLPRRRIFMIGMLAFTSASLVSGFASSAGELIAARGTQGVGAALMTPAALSLIMTTYAGAQRARGLALWGAIGGLGIAAGVLVGGVLTTWAGWQAIFWVNVPIGVVALVVAAQVLPDEPVAAGAGAVRPGRRSGRRHGLGLLMFAISGTERTAGPRSEPWSLWQWPACCYRLRLIERRTTQPLVPPHTWSIKPLVSGTVVMLGVTGLLVGAVFLASIFLQTVLGYSALEAGLGFLPLAIALVVGTHVAAHIGAHAAAPGGRRRRRSSSPAAGPCCSPASGAASVRADLMPGPDRPRPRRRHGLRGGVRLRHGRHPRPSTPGWPPASS